MIDLTVIIPVYNVESYLARCLDSIIIQTLRNIEIICVNDASTDNSLSILEEYAKKDSRIKIINYEENHGPSYARYSGLLKAQSAYISYIDSDDYISIEYLEDLYYTARIYDADICFTCNIYTVKDNNKKHKNNYEYIIKPYYHNRVSTWMNDKNITNNWYEGISYFDFDTPKKENTREYPLVNMWNKVFRVDFIKNNNLLSSTLNVGEDVDFFYRALALKPTISFNHKAIYYYYQRSNSIMHSIEKENEIPTDILEVFKNVFLFNKEHNNEKLIDSTYWNFRSFLHTFDNYKGNKKQEFYTLTHNLFKELDVYIDKVKYPFESKQIETIKTNDSYLYYHKTIENIKKYVYAIAWFIPKLSFRETFKQKALSLLFKNKK